MNTSALLLQCDGNNVALAYESCREGHGLRHFLMAAHFATSDTFWVKGSTCANSKYSGRRGKSYLDLSRKLPINSPRHDTNNCPPCLKSQPRLIELLPIRDEDHLLNTRLHPGLWFWCAWFGLMVMHGAVCRVWHCLLAPESCIMYMYFTGLYPTTFWNLQNSNSDLQSNCIYSRS